MAVTYLTRIALCGLVLTLASEIKACSKDSDCSSSEACIDEACVDPCNGVCGTNTICNVMNHHAACACRSGFIGNPFHECTAPETGKLKKKFSIGNEMGTWYGAIQRCLDKDMRLASITSAEEQAELERAYTESGALENVWIYGYDRNARGDYVWNSTGQKFRYTHWGPREPEISRDYRCISARRPELRWQTSDCRGWISHVCEYY
ncbi:secretory phospholipase A2 receptor-like isoform X1 [Homalodisca vitripennis]|uniref:secretory phospholipase A2 receptor-like isoform X1 n=1 Tax=Homalodisca vitripennis TaxID=197043 RepID=UPI001EEA58CB|nr:secretory phospholipase A2 receptor-like isoform X1 [Homalodisca vitripennis]